MGIKGTLKEMIDCGTIIDVTITDKDNQDHSVLIDHRMYAHMVEDKGYVIGKQVTYDDVTKDITFDEDLC